MPALMSPAALKARLAEPGEIALLDVREAGPFGEGHLFLAVPLPYSRLEREVERLVPRRTVPLVLAADDTALALTAAHRLETLGYDTVSVLDGGVPGWAAAGYTLFKGVNVPSKTFGELVEHAYGTPRVGPAELARWLAEGRDVAVLDGRPVEEFRKMSIPGAVCCPNGELAYRLRDLVPSPATTVIINCAGRTRSIIGAQTLINLGIPNPVFALENGTQGWFLADLPLDHGADRRYPDSAVPAGLVEARAAVRRLAERFAVPRVDAATLASWRADPERTTFLLDVRTAAEFAAGHLEGAAHAPGGQLIQATDQYVGVLGARLVLYDAHGVRAPVVASWLRQLGRDAVVLEGGLASGVAIRRETAPAAKSPFDRPAGVGAVDLAEARTLMVQGALVVDVGSSARFRARHIPGALWSIRPRLAGQFAGTERPLLVVADDPDTARLAALDLGEAARGPVRVLSGGLAAWAAAGLPLAASPHDPPDADRIDHLFFVHDRHDGNKEAARHYLAWETALVGQLDAAERALFTLPETPTFPKD